MDAVTLSLQRVRSTKTKVHNTTGNKGYYYARKKKLHSCIELKAKQKDKDSVGKGTKSRKVE